MNKTGYIFSTALGGALLSIARPDRFLQKEARAAFTFHSMSFFFQSIRGIDISTFGTILAIMLIGTCICFLTLARYLNKMAPCVTDYEHKVEKSADMADAINWF
jgi:hypothetical protein